MKEEPDIKCLAPKDAHETGFSGRILVAIDGNIIEAQPGGLGITRSMFPAPEPFSMQEVRYWVATSHTHMESKHLPTVSDGCAGMTRGVFQNDARDVDFCTTELGPEILF